MSQRTHKHHTHWKMVFYTLVTRAGKTHGSRSMTLLTRGYNSTQTEPKKMLSRTHVYWALRRNARIGYSKRYKGCHFAQGMSDVDCLYD